MKRSRRFLPLVLCVSGFAAACIGGSVGCGNGDDNSSGVPSPSDASADGTPGKGDSSSEGPGFDATTDASKADGGTEIDATVHDGGETPDTGATTEHDADAALPGLDGGTGSDADAGSSSHDASPDVATVFFDAGEAGVSIATYATEVATALCQGLDQCCSPPSGMVFDLPNCIAMQSATNYNQGINLGDGGNLVLDPAKAQACLNDLVTVNCASITAAEEVQQFSDCYSALVGTLGTGAPCVGSIECNPNDFCDTPRDGGTVGTCQPLRGTGQPCGDFGTQDLNTSEEACSYRGSGNNGLRCANMDLNSHETFPDAASWACEPEVAPDASCNVSVDCTTKLCDPGANFDFYYCVNSHPYVYPLVCTNFYAAADGG
jgi:hypothetical protein